MGAYLSQPKTDKESTDEFNNYLTVGASSMQGWRNSQEPAEKIFELGWISDAMEDEKDEDLAELHEEGNLPLDEDGLQLWIADAANRLNLDPDAKPEGSSTSKAALTAMQDGPSSSKLSSSSAVNKIGKPKRIPTVSSSSSSASKSNSTNSSTNNAAEAEAAASTTVAPETATNGTPSDVNSPPFISVKKTNKTVVLSSSELDDDDDDADFEATESNARQALEYSSEDEEELGDDDTTDEDADYDDDEIEEDEESRRRRR
ncbi:hypothetical protein DOY81_012219 [Sarcophaga bullata]|nr:hypothetical protein DOY81_012219 [Sarcophaga bullata]